LNDWLANQPILSGERSHREEFESHFPSRTLYGVWILARHAPQRASKCESGQPCD